MYRKELVVNQGHIAIRAFRAAYELGALTVAVFTHEDRHSWPRSSANGAYQISELGHSVLAHLNVSEVIPVAKLSGADVIYQGYGFFSENPGVAQAAARTGIVFRHGYIVATTAHSHAVRATAEQSKEAYGISQSRSRTRSPRTSAQKP